MTPVGQIDHHHRPHPTRPHHHRPHPPRPHHHPPRPHHHPPHHPHHCHHGLNIFYSAIGKLQNCNIDPSRRRRRKWYSHWIQVFK